MASPRYKFSCWKVENRWKGFLEEKLIFLPTQIYHLGNWQVLRNIYKENQTPSFFETERLSIISYCSVPAGDSYMKESGMLVVSLTGGHFGCACVHPLNDNSVGASNLMAGKRKLARKVTVFLKAISLVLWIPYFPTKKKFSMKKIGRFLRGFSLVDFSAVGFLGLLKTRKTQRQKVMFLYKSDFHWQSNAFQWFDFQTRGFI